jgi:deoxyhypusine synthase
VWGGLSGATPAEAVSWGKVNPGVLPDTVVAYADSTIAFPLFCEYAVGSANGPAPRKELVTSATALVAALRSEAKQVTREAIESSGGLFGRMAGSAASRWGRSPLN